MPQTLPWHASPTPIGFAPAAGGNPHKQWSRSQPALHSRRARPPRESDTCVPGSLPQAGCPTLRTRTQLANGYASAAVLNGASIATRCAASHILHRHSPSFGTTLKTLPRHQLAGHDEAFYSNSVAAQQPVKSRQPNTLAPICRASRRASDQSFDAGLLTPTLCVRPHLPIPIEPAYMCRPPQPAHDLARNAAIGPSVDPGTSLQTSPPTYCQCL